MLESLKEKVLKSNLELVKNGLVIYTWGNASGIDRERNLVVIKPSGIDFNSMSIDDMVIVDLYSGKVVEGHYKPSSDTPTHLEMYKAFKEIGGIVHTHSVNAVAFAQAGLSIKALGTTHADVFCGDVPCTRSLTKKEVDTEYEKNTGLVIVETIKKKKINPLEIPGIVVRNHGPFTWGKNTAEAVYNATVLEKIAEIDIKTLFLNSNSAMPKYILEKHYKRKHGPCSYYGQNTNEKNK